MESFADWTQPFTWAFVQSFATPAALEQAGKRRWEKFLHLHKLWRPDTAPQRLAAWAQGQQLNASPAILNAKSLLALSLVRVLQSLQQQIDEYRARIRAAFRAHPDHDIFGSLPGAKDKLAPRLLAELGSQREIFPDAQSLLCYAGASPVSFQSGQSAKPASAGPAIISCVTRCTCGPTRVGAAAPGRRPITKPSATRGTVMPAPCVAWENAGSNSSGACGRTT